MTNNNSILIAEDDLDINSLMVELLEDEGYSCVSAQDGLAAKEILETQKFDLLITDFRMPKLDGIQLLDWCRVANIETAVIFVSASSDLATSELTALEKSSARILYKPINIDQFISLVQETLTKNQIN